jgi:hypothetical protein
MSDLSINSRENQRQLEDLKQEQEQKLQSTRADYKRREKEVHQAGQAAINHIRRSTEERVENIRSENESRLKTESEQYSRNYSDLKRRAQKQNDSLSDEITTARERAQRNIASIKNSETQAMRDTQVKLKEFVETQNALRDQARDETNKNIEIVQRKGNEQVTAAKQKASDDLKNTELGHKRAINELRDRNDSTFKETRDQADRRLSDLKRDGETKMEKEREQKNRSITELQKKYRDAIHYEQREGERRVNELERKNQQDFEKTRAKNLRTNEEMRTEYSLESQRLQIEGEDDIRQRQARFEDLRKRQDLDNEKRLQRAETDVLNRETRMKKESDERLNFEADRISQTIEGQREEFKKRFDLNDKTNKSTLRNQQETYLKELYKQKKRFDERFGVEHSRKDDPFYRLKSFDASVSEKPGAYVLTARVAPHERDSVDVRVKNDKITLSAKRSYEDGFTSDDGSRVSTNSYQTYRQEFRLDVPVQSEKVIKKVDDDGNITVIVPKKGYSKA